MSGDIKGINAITLFVEDLAAAKAFQQTVLGKPLKEEDESSAAYDFDGVVVNLLVATLGIRARRAGRPRVGDRPPRRSLTRAVTR